MANRFFLTMGLFQLFNMDKKLRQFMDPWVACALLQLYVYFAMMNVKQNHSWYHSFATKDMDVGLPYSSVSD
jgi:hypothetical protein